MMNSGIEIYSTAYLVLLTEVFLYDSQGLTVPLEIKQINLCLHSLFAIGGIHVKTRELLKNHAWNCMSEKKTSFFNSVTEQLIDMNKVPNILSQVQLKLP